jgi:hypothetical protein
VSACAARLPSVTDEPCALCGSRIGYERVFAQLPEDLTQFVHGSCLDVREAAVEAAVEEPASSGWRW